MRTVQLDGVELRQHGTAGGGRVLLDQTGDLIVMHAPRRVAVQAGGAVGGRDRGLAGLDVGATVLSSGVVKLDGDLATFIVDGFGQLSEERLAVLAAALIIVGIQIFFSSFLLSILGLRRTDNGRSSVNEFEAPLRSRSGATTVSSAWGASAAASCSRPGAK